MAATESSNSLAARAASRAQRDPARRWFLSAAAILLTAKGDPFRFESNAAAPLRMHDSPLIRRARPARDVPSGPCPAAQRGYQDRVP
jgi:hypothetical protein